MSVLDQIGVPRSRRGARRGQQNQGNVPMQPFQQPNQQVSMQFQAPPFQTTNSDPQQYQNIPQQIPQGFNMPQQQPIQQQIPQQNFGFAPQIQPQQQQPQQQIQQPTTQQLLEILAQAEKKNMEMKQELALHQQKIEILEKQMLVFFGKIDRYEQARNSIGNKNGNQW